MADKIVCFLMLPLTVGLLNSEYKIIVFTRSEQNLFKESILSLISSFKTWDEIIIRHINHIGIFYGHFFL